MTMRLLCLVGVLVLMARVLVEVEANGGSLEAESPIQLPRAVIVDSDTPPKVVGQAMFSGNTATVVLKYAGCPVPLNFQAGELIGPSGGYFITADCTGTPYMRANTQPVSPLGSSCGVFMANADREVFQLLDNAPKNMVTFNSRYSGNTTCDSWGPELWNAPTATTPMIGDLDDLFVGPFVIQP